MCPERYRDGRIRRRVRVTSFGLLAIGLLVLNTFGALGSENISSALDPVGVYEYNNSVTQMLQQDAGSVLLGRPTDKSVTINIIAQAGMEAYVEYGTVSEFYAQQSATSKSQNGEPIEILLSNLSPNTRYYYKSDFKLLGDLSFKIGVEHSFVTQRANGSSFTFAVEADPHLDEQSDPEIYRQTLQNILLDKPDFLIDLGDTFMSEKLPVKNYTEIEKRHVLLREYFDITGADVPLFLALGNHEGESGWELNGKENSLAVMATNIRKQYYPNPSPDHFYFGNSNQEQFVGLRENYYSFEWGSTLIVVIDPYWYTMEKPSTDGWGWTLGKQQYDWFKGTLENSNASYKFVFAHQLVGGDSQGRGGAEEAGLYEWGGNNLDGSYGFEINRPGWAKPIHQLLVDNNVDAFFHGHDHFFAKQELDGIIYQLVPQPSHSETKIDPAGYGYLQGTFLSGSGHLRVTISQTEAKIEFVKYNQEIACSYLIPSTDILPSPSQTPSASAPVTPPASSNPSSTPIPAASPASTPSNWLVNPTQSPQPLAEENPLSLLFVATFAAIGLGAFKLRKKKFFK
jgi:hypothetical protein